MPTAEKTLTRDLARDLARDWPEALYETLKAAGVGHMAYVPDTG